MPPLMIPKQITSIGKQLLDPELEAVARVSKVARAEHELPEIASTEGEVKLPSKDVSVPRWPDIVNKEEYWKLSDEEKLRSKELYFNKHVQHKLTLSQIPEMKEKFYELAELEDKKVARKRNYKSAKEVIWQKGLKPVLKSASRVGGIVLGSLDFPAFWWGMLSVRHEDPEAFKKLSLTEQTLAVAGGGLESYRTSLMEKGRWGTRYGEYFQKVTGQTIEEKLPPDYKYLAPTLSVLGDLIADPFLYKAIANRLATTTAAGLAKYLNEINTPKVIAQLKSGAFAKDVKTLKQLDKLHRYLGKKEQLVKIDKLLRAKGDVRPLKELAQVRKQEAGKLAQTLAKRAEKLEQTANAQKWWFEHEDDILRNEIVTDIFKTKDEYRAFMKDNMLADEAGDFIPWFHGRRGEAIEFSRFERTWDIGYHFGTYSAAKQKAGAAEPIMTAIKMRNPLHLPDLGSWDARKIVNELWKDTIITGRQNSSFKTQLLQIENWLSSSKWKDRGVPITEFRSAMRKFGLADDTIDNLVQESLSQNAFLTRPLIKDYVRTFVGDTSKVTGGYAKNVIQKLGYDGVIYNNKVEGAAISGKNNPSVIIFDAANIKWAGSKDKWVPYSRELAQNLKQKLLPLQEGHFQLVKTPNPVNLAALATKTTDTIATIRSFEKTTGKKLSQLSQLKTVIDDAVQKHLTTYEALKNTKGKKTLANTAKKTALQNASRLRKLADSGAVSKNVKSQINKILDKALGSSYTPEKSAVVRGSAGFIAGYEEDKDGNITFSPSKALLGFGLAVGGLRLSGKKSKAFLETLNNYPAWAKVHNTMFHDLSFWQKAKQVGRRVKSFEFYQGLYSDFHNTFFDRFKPVEVYSKIGYESARIFNTWKDVAQIKFRELQIGLSKVKKYEALFSDYVLAHRTYVRLKNGVATKGIDLGTARQAIDDIEDALVKSGGNVQDFRTALGNFHQWSMKHILRYGVQSGLVSKQHAKNIIKRNDFYATFQLLDDMPEHEMLSKLRDLPVTEYFNVGNQKIIQNMIGTSSARKIRNPILATVSKFNQMRELGARNVVVNSIVDHAKNKELIKRVVKSDKELAILRQKGVNAVKWGTWDKSWDTVARMVDGKVEHYLFPREVADTLKVMHPHQAHRLVKAWNQIFRKSATGVYLPFTISNMFRDGFLAYVTAPVFKTGRLDQFATSWLKGLYHGAKFEFTGTDDVVVRYLESGGGFGWSKTFMNKPAMRLFEKTAAQKGIAIVTSPFDLISKVTGTVELAPRIGIYQRATKLGYTSKQAALMARESTIDFSRGGTFAMVMNQWIPFLNANIQGKFSLLKALTNPKTAKQSVAKMFSLVAPAGAGSYFWNRMHFSKEYDDIPQEIRDNYFVTIYGTEKNEKGKMIPKYVAIPKGDVGQLGWNLFEKMLDKQYKKDKKGFFSLGLEFLETLSPVAITKDEKFSLSRTVSGLTPPLFKAGIEQVTERNLYYDKPIEPEYMKRSVPPGLRAFESTPRSYKWLGKKFGISPLKVQNFMTNLFASYGREGGDPASMLRGLTGRLTKTIGGNIRNQASETIRDIEKGRNYTRTFALEAIKNGDRRAAQKILNEWNKAMRVTIKDYNEQFGQYDLEDKGGLMRRYTFSAAQKRDILKSNKKRNDWLEDRLRRPSRRRRR